MADTNATEPKALLDLIHGATQNADERVHESDEMEEDEEEEEEEEDNEDDEGEDDDDDEEDEDDDDDEDGDDDEEDEATQSDAVVDAFNKATRNVDSDMWPWAGVDPDEARAFLGAKFNELWKDLAGPNACGFPLTKENPNDLRIYGLHPRLRAPLFDLLRVRVALLRHLILVGYTVFDKRHRLPPRQYSHWSDFPGLDEPVFASLQETRAAFMNAGQLTKALAQTETQIA
ncbi:hypothetical protein C8R45DRAFT_929631 [Mycena sanguinolenta]|nr:hypothetical protein C8R45DRAFT_929631 [Mycena sanguinolenta]